MGINARLYNELFKLREVSLEQGLYRKYFRRIWPCPQEFQAFLQAESTQQQISSAVKIVERMSYTANFPLPRSIFQNLLCVEHWGTDRIESGYVAQDHVIHSINLYVLGIYLFFNHSLFHRRLIQYFEGAREPSNSLESPLESASKAFFTAWRIFALYHDVGYFFERTVDQDGIFTIDRDIKLEMLESYNHLSDEILYDLTVRALSRYLFADIIFKQSNIKFGKHFRVNRSTSPAGWRMINDTFQVTSGERMEEDIKPFSDYNLLYQIDSWLGFKQLLPCIKQPENVLTVLKDKTLRPVAVCFRREGHTYTYYKKELTWPPEKLLQIYRFGSEEFHEEDFLCEYYLSPEANNLFSLPQDQYYKTQLALIGQQVRAKLSGEFTLMPNDHETENLLFKISQWIRERVPMDQLNLDGHEAGRRAAEKANQDLLRDIVNSYVRKQIADYQFAKEHITDDLGRLIAQLKKKLGQKEFVLEVQNAYTEYINQDPDRQSVSILHTFLRNSIVKAREQWEMDKLPGWILYEKLPSGGWKIELCQTDRSEECLTQAALFELENALDEQAKALDLNIAQLKRYYDGRYSTCDHGVLSARIVREGYAVFQAVCQNIDEVPFLRYAWPVSEQMFPSDVPKKDADIFAKAIFSILLHNVYAKKDWDKSPGGIRYKQKLAVNPFSYFCAFCDNLQLWDRPRLMEPSQMASLPELYGGSTFDLFVDQNSIRLICGTRDIKNFLERIIDALKDYMEDAANIIRVTAAN